MDKAIFNINSALDIVPAYNNNVVHHFGNIGLATITELSIWFGKRIGKNIQFPGFLSTTKDANALKGQQVAFEIHTCENSNGKDMTTLDFKKPPEEEVTFKSGTFFNILNVQPHKITLVELSDIPDEYEVLGEDFYLDDEEVKKLLNMHDWKIENSSDHNLI